MLCARARAAMELTVLEMARKYGRLSFVLATLQGGGAGLSVVDFSAFHAAFLRRWKRSSCMPADGLRVWERHASGGWHAHYVCPHMDKAQIAAMKGAWGVAGSGFVSFKEVPVSDAGRIAGYLASELSKSRQKDFSDQIRRVRSWAAWGPCATTSGKVILLSEIGSLLKAWGPLRRGNAYKILCKLRLAKKAGRLPPTGSGPLRQWRACKGMCYVRLIQSGYILLRITGKKGKGSKMQVTLTPQVFVSQRVVEYTAQSGKSAGVKRVSLEVNLQTQDGGLLVCKMRLPAGVDVAAIKPLASMGDKVICDVLELRAWNGAVEVTLSSVTVCKATK